MSKISDDTKLEIAQSFLGDNLLKELLSGLDGAAKQLDELGVERKEADAVETDVETVVENDAGVNTDDAAANAPVESDKSVSIEALTAVIAKLSESFDTITKELVAVKELVTGVEKDVGVSAEDIALLLAKNNVLMAKAIAGAMATEQPRTIKAAMAELSELTNTVKSKTEKPSDKQQEKPVTVVKENGSSGIDEFIAFAAFGKTE